MNTGSVKVKSQRFLLILFLSGIAAIFLAYVTNPFVYNALSQNYKSRHNVMYPYEWELNVYGNFVRFESWQSKTYGNVILSGTDYEARWNAWLKTPEYQESQERLTAWENSDAYQALQAYETYDASVYKVTSILASVLVIIGAALIFMTIVIGISRLFKKGAPLQTQPPESTKSIGKYREDDQDM